MQMSDPHFSPARLKQIIRRMRSQRILVVGDVMLDRFVRGKVGRISPEAPIPVVEVTEESVFAGGAANVARNLAAFGIASGVCGVIGHDRDGTTLGQLLRKDGIDTRGLLVESRVPTIVKMRVIARQQQVVRVDWEKPVRLGKSGEARLFAHLERAVKEYDAVIIEDYGKGLVTQKLLKAVFAAGQRAGKPVAVDPNPRNPLDPTGATVVKPNRLEAFAAAGRTDDGGMRDAEQAGAELAERWGVAQLLMTLGEDGMLLFERGKKPYHTPTRAREVFDVSGAGDTAIAFYVAALAAGCAPREAAEIANHASGVVVSKLGTATVDPDELLRSFTDPRQTTN